MRKFILAASFCVLAYTMCQTVTLGQPISSYPTPPTVTCDGTKAQKMKCPAAMPGGYYEALECESEKSGHVVCYNALAYAQDEFSCTAAEAANTVPRLYVNYCRETNNIVNCTIRKDCLSLIGTRYSSDGREENYTQCRQGDITATYRYTKITLTSPECYQVAASPPTTPP